MIVDLQITPRVRMRAVASSVGMTAEDARAAVRIPGDSVFAEASWRPVVEAAERLAQEPVRGSC